MRILIFGNSITQGYHDTQGGWVARLLGAFIKKYGADTPGVFNLGISGNKTYDVEARFNAEAMARVQNRDDLIIFDVGTNDSCKKAGKLASTPDKFARDIKELDDMARKYVDNVAFMNLTPCDDRRVQPASWNNDLYYSNDRINQFNTVLENYVVAGGGI